jgi:hypothetical protein
MLQAQRHRRVAAVAVLCQNLAATSGRCEQLEPRLPGPRAWQTNASRKRSGPSTPYDQLWTPGTPSSAFTFACSWLPTPIPTLLPGLSCAKKLRKTSRRCRTHATLYFTLVYVEASNIKSASLARKLCHSNSFRKSLFARHMPAKEPGSGTWPSAPAAARSHSNCAPSSNHYTAYAFCCFYPTDLAALPLCQSILNSHIVSNCRRSDDVSDVLPVPKLH